MFTMLRLILLAYRVYLYVVVSRLVERKSIFWTNAIYLKIRCIVQIKYINLFLEWLLKACVRYIFASLFFKSEREHLWN